MKREMDQDGDVLIISPKKPEKHMPNIKFENMKGREDNTIKEDLNAGDELIIEPNLDAIRKKKPYLVVDFDKQRGREADQKYEVYEKDDYIYAGTEEERLNDPSKKQPVAYGFGKPKGDYSKLNPDIAELLEPAELVFEPEPLKKKVKGNVRFVEGPRFPEDAIMSDPDRDFRPPNTEMKIDKDKAFAATKPKGPSFSAPKAGLANPKKIVEDK
jgi:hypothetical protein